MSLSLVLSILAGLMLMLSFILLGRMRLTSLVHLFAWQSALLALYALVASRLLDEPPLLITAALTLGLKAIIIPKILLRAARQSQASMRLQSYLKPASSLFVGAVACFLAVRLSRSLALPVSDTPATSLIIPLSLSLIFLGFLMLIIRKGMYGQMVGFLMMENGIFTFGLALTGGMPLLVEIGIFADVMIGSVLMAALSYRVQQVHESVETDQLTELVD